MDGLLWVIIILIFLSLILTSISLFLFIKNNKKPTFDYSGDLKVYFQKEYSDLKYELQKMIYESSKTNQNDFYGFKEQLVKTLDEQIRNINEKVELRLGEGFNKTNETFISVIERLVKIDEAQKKIEQLSTEVISLNDILTDKKSRGIFGEVQLYQVLSAVFGEDHKLYEKQKTLSNQTIADAVIYAPNPLGMIVIDSKFPLDNYRKIVDRTISNNEREIAIKEFKINIKKHINDIKTKYIIPNETATQAMMFVPAEAIFAEISAYHTDLIEYAHKSQVFIVSPTTLISTLSTIQAVSHNIETSNQAKQIIEELKVFGIEFSRYTEIGRAHV